MSKISSIKKRDGRVVPFNQRKITNAIFKAVLSVGGTDIAAAQKLSDHVIELVEKQLREGEIPTVEGIQDLVEKVLIESGHAKTVKAYIIYRQQRAQVRQEKKKILEKEETDEVDKQFELNALRVLKSRYLRKNEAGRLVEAPKELFTRVAVHVGLPEIIYDPLVYDMSGKSPKYPQEQLPSNGSKLNIGDYGDYELNIHHIEALKRMYDRNNAEGKMRISWAALIKHIQEGKFNRHTKAINSFYNIMVSKRFMPNTPAIANFGNPLGMGSACFVLGIDDSMEDIMDTLKKTAIIFKAGGGVGFNFSNLRPDGDFVSTTSGIASGPMSFMRLFDVMTEVVKQGGIRRGANMGILNSNHPDIEKFITAKEGNKALRNFNISVLMMPDFWEYYEKNEPYPLLNPRNGEVIRTVNTRMLFDMMVYQAWESAEPGVIFYDHVNKYNPFFETLGPITTTNPCGEVLLYPNESCNLGSLNVWAFAKTDGNGKTSVDWESLKEAVNTATKFLDNVIDVNRFPLEAIEKMTLSTRKVGLGIMGLGDLLYELRLSYNSEEGRKFMEQLMEFINYYSKVTSIEIAKTRGSFPLYNQSFYPKSRLPIRGYETKEDWHFDWDALVENIKKYGIRNSFTTVIAPTGSISMIAGCSSGIEPVYSLVFEKNVKVGNFYYVDPVFEKVMKAEGLYDDHLMEEVIQNRGSIKNISYITPALKQVFVTALDISPADHIMALASFQKWVDSSISKTNNFPANATVDDMRESYLLAYKLGCKDVTVYRDASINDQVLVAGSSNQKEMKESPIIISKQTTKPQSQAVEKKLVSVGAATHSKPAASFRVSSEEPLVCPNCHVEMKYQEGCACCPECGWGMCS